MPSNPQTSSTQTDILSVSQLNRRSKQLLETHLPLLWVEGEISNLARPSSGHWYFTLKDSQAQIRCAMFKGRNSRLRFAPSNGQQLLVRGRVSLYEGRGDYQLIVEHMEEAGAGALQRAFEELKAKLGNEGLFAPQHKQALPTHPQHIGVITSPTGAAVHDILSVLERRYPLIEVTVLPVAVQGREAAAQIARAIYTANQFSQRPFDVLIVGRGGGSLEDLWPFNEEVVARAIFDSQLPIVSAVGHEVDFTIADFVADLRAPTPSVAAETLSPDGDELLETFAGFEVLLEQAMERRLQQAQQKIEWLRSRLRHPGQHLDAQAQHLDNLEMRLRHSVQLQLQTLQTRLGNLIARQQPFHPQEKLQQQQLQLKHLKQRLTQQIQQQLQGKQQQLAQVTHVLDAVSPLATLQRGYAIVKDSAGKVIRRHKDVAIGDKLSAQLGEGEIFCQVEALSADKP